MINIIKMGQIIKFIIKINNNFKTKVFYNKIIYKNK